MIFLKTNFNPKIRPRRKILCSGKGPILYRVELLDLPEFLSSSRISERFSNLRDLLNNRSQQLPLPAHLSLGVLLYPYEEMHGSSD